MGATTVWFTTNTPTPFAAPRAAVFQMGHSMREKYVRANPSHSRASSLPSLLSSYLLKMVSAFSLTRGSFPTPPNIASNRRYSASMASVSSATSRLGSESSPSWWLMPAHFSNTSFRTASNSLDKIRSIHCCFCARALPDDSRRLS